MHKQLPIFRRELRRVGIRDHKADVVPRHFCFLNTERLSEVMNSDGSVLHVQPIIWNRGVANAGQVWRNYRETLRENWDDWSPHERSLGITVQQNERGAVASSQVVQLNTTDFCVARGNTAICNRRRRSKRCREQNNKTNESCSERLSEYAFHKRTPDE